MWAEWWRSRDTRPSTRCSPRSTERSPFDWDPAVTGSLQAVRSGTTTAEVSEALLAELSSFGEIAKGGLNRSTLELAARLLPDHLPTEYPTPS